MAKVSVFPLYEDDGKTGDLCSYAEHHSLEVAMGQAGRGAQLWIDSPAERGEEDRGDPVGFEVTVDVRQGDPPVPERCTGYRGPDGALAHDDDTCPIHESGDPDALDPR